MSTSVYIVKTELINYIHLPVLHFNGFLTTQYSETTAHFNNNFDVDKQLYIP
jgi:hypothetical protein